MVLLRVQMQSKHNGKGLWCSIINQFAGAEVPSVSCAGLISTRFEREPALGLPVGRAHMNDP
jgi:hypothetical protein